MNFLVKVQNLSSEETSSHTTETHEAGAALTGTEVVTVVETHVTKAEGVVERIEITNTGTEVVTERVATEVATGEAVITTVRIVTTDVVVIVDEVTEIVVVEAVEAVVGTTETVTEVVFRTLTPVVVVETVVETVTGTITNVLMTGLTSQVHLLVFWLEKVRLWLIKMLMENQNK
jgi:hypothetical protein